MQTYGREGDGRGLEHGIDVGREKLEWIRERLGGVGGRLETLVRERPGTALLIALGAGFLIGRWIRR